MFVIIATLVSATVIASLYYFSQKREAGLSHKYQLLVALRALVHLCRQHRTATHFSLQYEEDRRSQIASLQHAMDEKSEQLIDIAPFDKKNLYRVLQTKLQGLISHWPELSVARNQMLHGKIIRHCLFLMDEVTMSWLSETENEELRDDYHHNWHIVVDSLEALTQLRMNIPYMLETDGSERIRHYSEVLLRKLNQMALISPLSIASPASTKAITRLSEYIDSDKMQLSSQELYTITADISLTIFHVYDQVLSDMMENLYMPLPKLSVA